MTLENYVFGVSGLHGGVPHGSFTDPDVLWAADIDFPTMDDAVAFTNRLNAAMPIGGLFKTTARDTGRDFTTRQTYTVRFS
jgi:hypothetical protein